MKYSVSIILFIMSQLAYAGSPSCSNITHVTASGDYSALTTDCIVSVEKTFFESTTITLPSGASTGDEFTVQDNTAYTLDDCEDYGDPGQPIMVCNPAGVTINAFDAALVDGSQSVTLAGYYYQDSPSRQRVKFVFDGSDWNATYSSF